MPRILLVYDDKDHLKLFTMILENRGYSFTTYSDPAAALLKFKPNYYDLLLPDYRMPNLNGLELYARMREIDPSTKALLLTASHEQLTDENNQIQGRDNLRVIRKPITNEELLSEIDSILNQVTTPVLDMVQLVKRQ